MQRNKRDSPRWSESLFVCETGNLIERALSKIAGLVESLGRMSTAEAARFRIHECNTATHLLRKWIADDIASENSIHTFPQASGRHLFQSDTKAIMQSIEKLTDPYDNSINEKCARIKMAFMSKFNDEIARWYYVEVRK